jgi:tetratricopeptide (TPR) repeat protein
MKAPEPVTVPAPPPATVPAPKTEPPTKPMPVVEPRSSAKPQAPPKPKKSARKPKVATPVIPAKPAEPDPALVQEELASLAAPELTSRADSLYSQGHTGVAASYYRRALERDPDYAPALVGIGRSILRAEKHDDAMENATRALQLARGVDARPGLEAEAIYQIARVHLYRDELDAARRLFRQSISLPGTPAAAWFYLGEALWNDNSPAARVAYERYLQLVPKGHLADRARRAIQ